MNYRAVHITGASGSGTTTLAKALRQRFGYIHLDSDDFFWEPTDPPFVKKRPIEERQKLMLEEIEKAPKFVLSGSLTGWGDIFIPRFDLVVYVKTPTEVRIKRLKEREYHRFGDRILPNGDMYEDHQKFLKWAAGYDDGGLEMRSALHHKQWLRLITCPVITVDGTRTTDENLKLLGV